MTQRESRLSRTIIAYLKTEPRTWCFKQWGNARVVAGLPDIMGVCNGRFFGLEVKLPESRSNVSERQAFIHKQIKRAGGFVAVVCSIHEAKAALTACRSGIEYAP